MFHAESMNLFPFEEVIADQNNHGRGRMDHVTVRTTAKRQVVSSLKLHHVGKRIVLSVVKNAANVVNCNGRQVIGQCK